MSQSAHCNHDRKASTPTIVCRIPIFAPTRRPHGVSEWRVETPWGSAIITGRLGQQHRDLLDAVRMIAEAEQWTTDGRLHVKFDPARLRSAMGGDSTNTQRIEDWIEDLRKAKVEVRMPDGRVIVGGIVGEYELSADPTVLLPRAGMRGEGRRYMKLSFGSGWSRLIETEQMTYYPLAQVVALRHGFSQAVARYCLSHTTVRDTVAGLMFKVGAGGEKRKRRGELHVDASGLLAMGIEVDGDQIRKQSPVKTAKAVAKSSDPVAKSSDRKQSPVKNTPYQYYQYCQAGNQLRPDGGLVPCKSKSKAKTITPPSPAFSRSKNNACGATTQTPGGQP